MYTVLLVVSQNKELLTSFTILGIYASFLAGLYGLLSCLGGRKSV